MMTEAQVRERMERKRVLARMTETGSREAMLALHSTLADQMPDMTAEGGYWYALGYLEGALGLHRQEEVMREVARGVSGATYRHRQDKVEAEFGGSYQAACEAIVALREHRDQLRELLRRAKEDVKEDVKEGA